MGENSLFSVGDDVYVVANKAVRRNRLCDDCHNEQLPPGERCPFCQGYGDVFDRSEVVWEIFGPCKVTSVTELVRVEGTTFTYTIPDTWDKPHEETNVFKYEREADACRRIHLQ